jgi:hypothetical protein
MHIQFSLHLIAHAFSGDFAPYREDLITHFLPTDDGYVHCDDDDARIASLFRSSDRQKIIDFIIGSRIRDSGAELGPSTQLGKQIKARVPLHSHARLEALYSCWVTFWRKANWVNRDGKSLKVGPESPRETDQWHGALAGDASGSLNISSSSQKRIPSILHRFFVGSFHQPLDSIEEYYGEKVAFYFAWLQHVSFHLLYLSVIGLIVFAIQLSSGQWDHAIRPVSTWIHIWFLLLVLVTDSLTFPFSSPVVFNFYCDLVVCRCCDMAKTIQLSRIQMGYFGLQRRGDHKARVQGNRVPCVSNHKHLCHVLSTLEALAQNVH